jgi:hypothetical protein
MWVGMLSRGEASFSVWVVAEIGSWHAGIPTAAMVLEMCLLDLRLPSVGHFSDFDIEEICQGWSVGAG